jgi:hypothetical protein
MRIAAGLSVRSTKLHIVPSVTIPKFASERRNLNHTSFNKLVARLSQKFACEFLGRDTRARA